MFITILRNDITRCISSAPVPFWLTSRHTQDTGHLGTLHPANQKHLLSTRPIDESAFNQDLGRVDARFFRNARSNSRRRLHGKDNGNRLTPQTRICSYRGVLLSVVCHTAMRLALVRLDTHERVGDDKIIGNHQLSGPEHIGGWQVAASNGLLRGILGGLSTLSRGKVPPTYA